MNETGINLLKSNVIKPGSDLHSKLESRLTVTDIRSLNNATVYYEDEEIIVHGKSRTVRRLFVSKPDSDYDGIGWIINEDITMCMVCSQSFGFFRWPHHCRCCGNLVCNSCSPEVAVIFELSEMGEVRVCIQCYWGQDPVHVSNMRRDSDESSTESHPENEMDYYFSDHELGSLESVTPKSTQSMKLKLIIPVPAFVLDTTRKLSYKELGRMNVQNFATRKVYINICVHSCVPIITHGGEYFVSDDVAVVPRDAGRDTKSKYSSMQDRECGTSDKSEQDSVEYEVYHVLVDPNSLRASLSTDPKNMEKTDQLMMRIIRHLAIKFQLGLSKRFEQLVDCVYMGGSVTSMYVPFTGSELEDDEDLRDKTFSCDDEPCSDDESDAVTSNRPSEQETNRAISSERVDTPVSLSEDLKEWERRVSFEQLEQQAVDVAVEQLIGDVREDDMEEWEHKLLLERDEQRESTRVDAEALAIEVQRLADEQLAEQQRMIKQKMEQAERERIGRNEKEKEEEAKRVAAALKAENDSKAAAEKLATAAAAAAVVLAKQVANEEQTARETKKAADKAIKDKEERDRAAEKAAALAAVEAQRVQDRLDKETRAASARAEREKANEIARAENVKADAQAEKERLDAIARTAEVDRVAKVQKDLETKAANEAREQAILAERLSREQQDLEAKQQSEAQSRAEEAATLSAIESEAREREQQETARRREDELAAAAAAAAVVLATETARLAKEAEEAAVKAASDQRKHSEADASKAAISRRASQNKVSDLDISPRSSEAHIVVQIPEINVVPTAWCVIKTKAADMTKCFVNVGFHGALPNITETSHDTTAHEEYLNANFVQFTLNKKRCVMFVGSLRSTSDKDGSSCTLCDVTISMSAYNLCTKDESLVDKLFIKILKALKKRHGVDLDADYKLPKILKNYKGTDVLSVNVPAFRSNKLGPRSTGTDSSRSPSSDISGTNPMASPLKGSVTAPSSPVPISSSGRSSISPKRVSIVNPEWNQKWGKFVPAGKNIIYTSQIGKKNAMGITIVRQLLLTDEPSLLYVDAVSMTHKGDIEWLRGAPPKASFVDKSNFEIAVAKRVYKFNDRENNAALWVRKINEVAASVV